MAEINITIGLEIKTCSCGSAYAVPRWVTRYTCPMCASEHYAILASELEAARRTITALKGAITKLKKSGS